MTNQETPVQSGATEGQIEAAWLRHAARTGVSAEFAKVPNGSSRAAFFAGARAALSASASAHPADEPHDAEEHEAAIYPDLEGLTAAVFERSHERPFSDDSRGVREAKAFAQNLIDMYIDQSGVQVGDGDRK